MEQMWGIVQSGSGLGAKILVPTINVRYDAGRLPEQYGVYVCWVTWEGTRYAGVANIGKRPTLYNNGPRVVEVHLLDVGGDWYHRKVCIEWGELLREEQQFETVELLRAQIQQDIVAARKSLGHNGGT